MFSSVISYKIQNNNHSSLFMTLALSGKGPPSLLQSSCGAGKALTAHFSWIFEPTNAVSALRASTDVDSSKNINKI